MFFEQLHAVRSLPTRFHLLLSLIVFTLSLFPSFLCHFLSLDKKFIALRFVVFSWKRLIVPDHLSLVSLLVNYLFVDLFGLIFQKHVILNIPHKLLFFLFIDIRLVLVMDHNTVLPHPNCFQFAGLTLCLSSFLGLLCHLPHPLVSRALVMRLSLVLNLP